MNFLNNGIGPGAGSCAGQSSQNCSSDFSNCCSMSGGPSLYSRFANGRVSFSPMSPLQRSQWLQSQASQPSQKIKVPAPVRLPSVPLNGIGIL